MNGEGENAPLLPSPDAVRCELTLDVRMQVWAVIGELEIPRKDNEEILLREVVARLDSRLSRRLQQTIPFEELTRSARRNQIDIQELSKRLPFVYVMWAMVIATELHDLREVLREGVERERGEGRPDEDPEPDPAPSP